MTPCDTHRGTSVPSIATLSPSPRFKKSFFFRRFWSTTTFHGLLPSGKASDECRGKRVVGCAWGLGARRVSIYSAAWVIDTSSLRRLVFSGAYTAGDPRCRRARPFPPFFLPFFRGSGGGDLDLSKGTAVIAHAADLSSRFPRRVAAGRAQAPVGAR